MPQWRESQRCYLGLTGSQIGDLFLKNGTCKKGFDSYWSKWSKWEQSACESAFNLWHRKTSIWLYSAAIMQSCERAEQLVCVQATNTGRQEGSSVLRAASEFADLQVWMFCPGVVLSRFPTVSVHITDLDCVQKLKYSAVYSFYCHSRS